MLTRERTTLWGEVLSVTHSANSCRITIDLKGTPDMTAMIMKESTVEIGLAEGAKVASFEWKIAGPEGSTVQIAEAPADEKLSIPPGAATFTPDKEGTYTITVVATDGAGATSLPAEMKVEAARYLGADTCKDCHADQFDRWTKTGHATFFTEMVDTDPEGIYKDLGFNCARCHTVGYYPITELSTGGWWDVAVNVLNFEWPTDKIGQEGTFESFPAELKAVSNIQCENCHGPGGNHKGDPTKIGTSFTSGSCNQCHNDGHFHIKGAQPHTAAHANAGPITAANGRAECARCHSPAGFVDFSKGVEADQQRNQVGEIGCATCHDPHDSTNFAQLRFVNEVKNAPVEVTDAALSAVCMECHNARNTAENIVTETPQFPHYSAAAEALNDAGGYDFGVTIPNSPHGKVVGKSAVKEADGTDMFGGQVPGSCVYCHMYTTPGGNRNAKEVNGQEVEVTDPGHNQVGSHSFAMVSEDGTVQNLAACKDCHADITASTLTATADYDGNGTVEGVQDEIKGLLALVKSQREA
jgi:molybdopterin-binding protein